MLKIYNGYRYCIGTGTGKFSFFLVVSEPVSEKFGTENCPGTGLETNFVPKKSRYRSRKILVPKKVSESVSFRFWVSSHTVAKIAKNTPGVPHVFLTILRSLIED